MITLLSFFEKYFGYFIVARFGYPVKKVPNTGHIDLYTPIYWVFKYFLDEQLAIQPSILQSDFWSVCTVFTTTRLNKPFGRN